MADGEQDLTILPIRLDPGTYHVVVQVSGREESRAAGMAYLDAPDDAPEPEAVEHWWVSFVRDWSEV